jgi:Ca-activated chloride channel family protein
MGHRLQKLLRAGGGALLLALGAVALRAESSPRVPTFTVGVGVVSLNLVVTDAGGRQVPDLGPDDITLFEDGVPQPISLFAQEEWPIRLQVLLDGSGSMAAALPVAKRAATRLLRTLRPGDEAEVAQFNRSLSVLQESTGDLAALERAIDRVSPHGETALYNVLYVTLKDQARQRKPDEPCRRAIVVLSDGEDTASMVDDEQLIDLARRAGGVVYTIGLLTPPVAGLPAPTVPTYVLTALARETGGRAYFPRSLAELDGAYDRIASELRTLYGIGYVPLNARADGHWRRIAIQTRQGSLLVRHRPGYYAPAGESRSALRVLPASSR